jgi:hypothetical protein
MINKTCKVVALSLIGFGGYASAAPQFPIQQGEGLGIWTQSEKLQYEIFVTNTPTQNNSVKPTYMTVKVTNKTELITMNDVVLNIVELKGTNPEGEPHFVRCNAIFCVPSNQTDWNLGTIKPGNNASVTLLVLTFPFNQALQAGLRAQPFPGRYEYRINPKLKMNLTFGNPRQYLFTCPDVNQDNCTRKYKTP